MQSKGILVLFGIALLAGWLLPNVDPLAPPEPVGAASQGEAGATDAMQQDEEASGSVLPRQRDGHFYANVDVNSNDIRFMVDTGASGIALTAEDAESLGLSWDDDELQVVGRGASGNVYGKRVRLQSVQLGDLQITDVEAVIIPSGLDVSLLGQSFLSKAETVKIEDNQMVIS